MLGDILSGALSGGLATKNPWGALAGAGIGLLGGISKKKAAKRQSKGLSAAMASLKRDPAKEREERAASMKRGMQFAQKEILGEEGLGRLSQAEGMQDVLKRRRQQMEEGIPQEVLERRRSQMASAQSAGAEEQRRQLAARLGAAGMRGATAASQIGKVEAQLRAKQSDIETQLMMAQEQAKREGLTAFENTAGSIAKFDLGQMAKEKGILSSFGLSEAQMDEASKAQNAQLQAQMQMAKAQADAASGGGFLGLF